MLGSRSVLFISGAYKSDEESGASMKALGKFDGSKDVGLEVN